jgi:hypothetical protein
VQAFSLPSIGNLETLGVLFSLLPGLITFILYRSLTAKGKKVGAVDAILHGLAYTLVVHGIWSGLTSLGSLIPTPDIFGLTASAVYLALVLAFLSNNGQLYGWLRKLNLTQETSWSSVWESSFREFRNSDGEYVVIEFKDGRRILGAIRGFSNEQGNGHIVLQKSKWLHANEEQPEQPGMILVSAGDVSTIQFLPSESGESLEQEDPTPTPTSSGVTG